MIEYPKIETLYDRDEKTFKVMPDKLRCTEFGNIKQWHVTEKIDGTNVRIGYKLGGAVEIGGRTDKAQMPTSLMMMLSGMFTAETMTAAFSDAGDAEIVLFGEGYGGNIQKAGRGYRPTPSFRLFDVRVGEWWLEPENISDIAVRLRIQTVPSLGTLSRPPTSRQELAAVIALSRINEGGEGTVPEGIVARTVPLLLNRRGKRVMWKLKAKDF